MAGGGGIPRVEGFAERFRRRGYVGLGGGHIAGRRRSGGGVSLGKSARVGTQRQVLAGALQTEREQTLSKARVANFAACSLQLSDGVRVPEAACGHEDRNGSQCRNQFQGAIFDLGGEWGVPADCRMKNGWRG